MAIGSSNVSSLTPSGNKFGDLRRRLIFLVLALVVFRIGAHIPVPGIDPDQLAKLFTEQKDMVQLHPVFYLKGNNYLLESLFYVKYSSQFKETLDHMEAVLQSDFFPKNDNISSLSFLYLNSNKLNLHFLEGTFKQGLYLVKAINYGIEKHQDRLDQHHIMLLYYKIACLYFGVGDHKNCIVYLKKIILNKHLKMREDLMCFARVLSLVAHYESGMDYHLEIQIKSTFKFLLKMNDLHAVQKEMIIFTYSGMNHFCRNWYKCFILCFCISNWCNRTVCIITFTWSH